MTGLCQCAYKSLLTFLRKTVRLKDGVPGVVMAIHTFGEYPEKFLCGAPHKSFIRTFTLSLPMGFLQIPVYFM